MAEGGEEGVVMGLLDIVRLNTRLDDDAVLKMFLEEEGRDRRKVVTYRWTGSDEILLENSYDLLAASLVKKGMFLPLPGVTLRIGHFFGRRGFRHFKK